MNVLLPLLGSSLVVLAVSVSCCCCFVSCSGCCFFCCCFCVFSVCFSYTFAAALLRKRQPGKVGSLPFCCCCRCCLRATFTAAVRHTDTHTYTYAQHTHTHVTKQNEVGVRTNTHTHTRSHTHVVSNNFMHFSTEFIIMCIYENVCSACVCVSVSVLTEFLCWRLSYSHSALFIHSLFAGIKCIHNLHFSFSSF